MSASAEGRAASAAPISIWIVEDREVLRDAYVAVVDDADGFVCTGAFRSCEEALERLAADAPADIVLMDIELPGMSGVEGVRHIREQWPDTQVVMLTIHSDRDNVFDALCAGASGYLLKPTSAAGILSAVRRLLAGDVPMSPSIARRVLHIFQRLTEPVRDYGLSRREEEVLEHLVRAESQPDIAKALFISEHTVGNHVRNIYRKLEVHTRAGVVAKALRERLVDPE